MKKLLLMLLAGLLLLSTALAEGMMPVNTPITIDGVRVAFFDAEGNYLQPMEQNGLVWAPLNALCENLGKNAQVQGQSVMVDGVRIGMFDEAGNFLMPQEVNGTVYVPVVAFCQSAGIGVTKTEQGVAINRETEQEQPSQPESTPQPFYAYVPVTEANFLDFFTVETGTSYPDINVNLSPFTVTYKLTCRATTSYGLENVKFKVNKFGTVTMPSSGTVTKTVQDSIYRWDYKSDVDYIRGQGAFCTGAVLQSFSLEGASGKLRMSYQEAENLLAQYYEKGVRCSLVGDFEGAVKWYGLVAQVDYLDSKELLKEARSKKAAEDRAAAEAAAKKKEEENQKKYAAAQASFDNGDWDAAIKGFKALGDYEDSKAKVTAATENKNNEAYEAALALKDSGKYDEAIKAFEALGNYKDSDRKLNACRTAKKRAEDEAAYEGAEQLEAAGDYVGAYDAFIKIAYFEDSEQRAEKLAVYPAIAEAETKLQERHPEEAKKALEPYKDHPAAQTLYKTLALRGAELLVTAFNSEGWAVAKEGKTNNYLLNIEGDTKDFNGVEYQYSGWQDGLMLLKNQEGYLYADLKGEAAFERTFKKAEAFYQGKALVTGQDGAVCVIDTAGQTVAQMPEVSGRTYVTYMGENLVKFEEKDKYGLISLEGKVVVKAKYTKSISRFVDGLAVTCTQKGKNNAYSVINAKGKAVIKEGKYEIMNVLSENLIACYLRNDAWGKGKTYPGVINLQGKTIRKGEYNNKEFCRVGDYIMMRTESTSGSGASTGWTVFDKEGKYLMGYTSNIQPLVSGDGKHVYIENHKGGVKQLALLHEPNKWRRDLDGCQMDQASPYIALKKNDGWHVYDLDLNLIN